MFPEAFGLKGRPQPFPLRGHQTKQAELAAMQQGKIFLRTCEVKPSPQPFFLGMDIPRFSRSSRKLMARIVRRE